MLARKITTAHAASRSTATRTKDAAMLTVALPETERRNAARQDIAAMAREASTIGLCFDGQAFGHGGRDASRHTRVVVVLFNLHVGSFLTAGV